MINKGKMRGGVQRSDVPVGSVKDYYTTQNGTIYWLFGTVIAGGAGVGRWRKIKKARAPVA